MIGKRRPSSTDGADFDTTTPAVVLKLDPNVMHHGGLGAIRSLGRLGVPVYSVYEDSLAPAAHSRYLHGRWLWRPAVDDVERVLEGLNRLAEQLGRPAVLLPTDDAGAILLAEHGSSLHPGWRVALPHPDLPRQLAGKYSLYRLCGQRDVACPRAELVDSWARAQDFADETGFPLVAKLATPWRNSGDGRIRSTTVLGDRRELATFYDTCRQHDSARIMLQEFVPGGHGHDWFFHGYCDGTSACRPAFTGLKERSYPAHAGLTSLGRCVDNPGLRRVATDLLARLSFRGIVDMDWRWDARDGHYKLLDCNPRLGAQFRLFRDTAGTDVVLAAYLDLTGQTVPAAAPVGGRRFVVENYDPIAALRYWRNGEISLRNWVSSLRGVDETAWFATDDLAPFGLMCLRMGWRGITRRFGGHARPDSRREPVYRSGRAAPNDGGGSAGDVQQRREPQRTVGEDTI